PDPVTVVAHPPLPGTVQPLPSVARPIANEPVRATTSKHAKLPPAAVPREQRVPMTRMRQTIARRLKEAQNTAAMLTTFNEVDMSAVIELRHRYKDSFLKVHGAKLGFMS